LPTEVAPWEPLLEGGEADRALAIVSEIAVAVRDLPEATGSRCLLGATGRATFLAYAAWSGLADEAAATALLESDLVALCTQGCPVGLWHGYAGLRWALTHLAPGEDIVDPLERIDAVIRGALEASPWAGGHDLSDGLAGVALALVATPASSGSRALGRVVDHAEDWLDTRTGPVELGCAHGLAGVVGAVARLATAGVEPDRCARLLERAVPLLLDDGAEPDRNTSWCRGHAGLAVAVFSAGRAASRGDWEAAGVDLAHRAFRQARDQEPADACLCHGTAGLGHIANRFYQATRQDAFRGEALHFLRRAIEMRRPGEGAAGYSMLQRRAGLPTWVADTSLVVGAAGVGLALLAAGTPMRPEWDRLLLADFS